MFSGDLFVVTVHSVDVNVFFIWKGKGAKFANEAGWTLCFFVCVCKLFSIT